MNNRLNVDVKEGLIDVVVSAQKFGWSLDEIKATFDDVLKEFESKRPNDPNILAYGTHGECVWEINKEGTLKIAPDDGMFALLADQRDLKMFSPWEKHKNLIKKVEVAKGVATSSRVDYLFANLSKCETMDLSGLIATSAKSIDGMFSGCENLKEIDLSKVDDMWTVDSANMLFENCNSLTKVNLGDLNVPAKNTLFLNCHNLAEENIKGAFLPLNKTMSVNAWKPNNTKSKTKDLGVDR